MSPQSESVVRLSGSRDAEPTDHSSQAAAPFDLSELQAHLRPVELKRGQVLHRAGGPVDQVYILRGGLVRQFHILSDGKAAGALLGAGAAVGLHAALRQDPANGEAVVLWGGPAHRMSSTTLDEMTNRSATVARAAMLYMAREAGALHQTIACCSNHLTEGRLASLLLRTGDQLGTAVLPLTQEDLAAVLGIQRTTVTASASRMRKDGAISYARGAIRILDCERLRALSCGCFGRREDRQP